MVISHLLQRVSPVYVERWHLRSCDKCDQQYCSPFLSFRTSVNADSRHFYVRILFFTALHVMQTRYSDENSVRLSYACIVTKRKKDLSGFLYHTKDTY